MFCSAPSASVIRSWFPQMAIVPRTSTSSTGTQTSPSLAMTTVTGMVIGVLGLFVLVLTYQVIPCLHRKKPPANVPLRGLRLPATPPERPSVGSRIRHIRSKITTFFTSSNREPGAPSSESPVHKTLRSLHLPKRDQGKRRLAREKFATKLRLDLRLPPAANVLSSRTPRDRRGFAPLKEDVFSTGKRDGVVIFPTEKPPTALMSPWSPREQDFPYPSTPTPSRWLGKEWLSNSPPPFSPTPFSPPPAYHPGTPVRSGLMPTQEAMASDDRGVLTRSLEFAERDRAALQGPIDLSDVVVISPTQPTHREPVDDVFVITDDIDTFSDVSSRSSTWSCTTGVL